MKSSKSSSGTRGQAAKSRSIERRILLIGCALSLLGGIFVAGVFGLVPGLSFLAGGGLAAVGGIWLRGIVGALVFEDPKRSKSRVLGGFLLRLLLIPLALYAMIRFLYLSAPAAVAGFATFSCSIFVEGILEAIEGPPQ